MGKNLVYFLIVVGNCGSHEETFLLTYKVLARLLCASQQVLRLEMITNEKQLTTLLRLAVNGQQSSQLWLNHAIYCLVVDCLRLPSNAKTTSAQAVNSIFSDIIKMENLTTRYTSDFEPAGGSGSATRSRRSFQKRRLPSHLPSRLQ